MNRRVGENLFLLGWKEAKSDSTNEGREYGSRWTVGIGLGDKEKGNWLGTEE